MDLNRAFDEFQRTVDAEPLQVLVARSRRDVFKKALTPVWSLYFEELLRRHPDAEHERCPRYGQAASAF